MSEALSRGGTAIVAPFTLYTRRGCPLCEDMAAAVAAMVEGSGYAVQAVDVDADPTLKARYGWDVPLLYAGDVEICRHELDAVALRDWLVAHPHGVKVR